VPDPEAGAGHVDWIRRHRGRTKWQWADDTYERPRTKLVSLDGVDRKSIDWMRLSPRSTAILRLVATPISAGFSPSEIAHELGTSQKWVSSCLDELRDEIERQRR
jgi:DNA-binding NarL/FixJ family response regulator